MKILLIHTHYQLQGGEDAVVEQELEFLKQHHDVEILRFQNLSIWKGALQFLVSIWNIGAAKKVKSKIREFQPDVVHVHNWHFAMGPLVFRVINRLGIPLVHTVHNYRLLCPSAILLNEGKLFTKSLKDPFPWSAVRNKVYRSSAVQTFWLAFVVWFHKKIGTWQKIDGYVCLTPFAVGLFQQSTFGVSKEQFTVKPNFTNVVEISDPIKREEHFLFIGRLSEEKGIQVLINAFKELPFLLRIAGDGPLKEQVLNAVKQSPNISYLGNINNDEVTEELRKTQALIFPSVCFETFGLVNIEAFATHTPVLASNIGAPQSLIKDGYNGFLFEPGDVANLKKVVAKFDALSIIEKEQMGTNAFESYQSKYSPASQHRYFDSVYSKALKK
ncbi:glycosyltransferase involved in cell wall biosynthesis [Flavobacterium sp. CG_9.10]|uniref:glycosyltransferase n=1 Tax=Flavobacterium sp. CG_9.10 TaxID=2787729 RepID=UPI0018C99196|nr:glycosyltransferase [Flavobacterium sp. CG_9.10]MBG6109877.1 glycosyltransferase involved in cell wall biosynthesis [Flavobacterium sp. CG_9.10]